MIIMQSHLFDELAEMQRESSYSDECSNMDDCQPACQREIAEMFGGVALMPPCPRKPSRAIKEPEYLPKVPEYEREG